MNINDGKNDLFWKNWNSQIWIQQKIEEFEKNAPEIRGRDSYAGELYKIEMWFYNEVNKLKKEYGIKRSE